MDLFPVIGFTWLGGWIYFLFYSLVFYITIGTSSKVVRKRLYDRSMWNRKTIIIVTIGNSLWLVNIVLILLGRLKIGRIEFILGTIVFIFGLVLLEISILTFRNSPIDKLITTGIYKISRNPQMIALYLVFLGMLLVIGTWMGLGLLLITIVFSHFTLLAEERMLKSQYGESYILYCEKVSRYFLFF